MPPIAQRLLGLQRKAGNGAVNRLLQRQPDNTPAEDMADATESPTADIVAEYPILPGTENSLERKITFHDESVGDVNRPPTAIDDSYRVLNRAGLRAHLLGAGDGALAPFEENLIAKWPGDTAQLIPLHRIGDRGIVGYVVDTGGADGRIRTVYTVSGDVLLKEYGSGPGLVSEGLGPIDWIFLVGGAVALGKLALAKFVAKRAVAAEAAAVVEGREFIAESEGRLAVIENGEIIASSRNTLLSHEVFVRRELGYTPANLPAGVEVVTIGKHQGEIGAMLSGTFHGSQRLASFAAQQAARRAYR